MPASKSSGSGGRSGFIACPKRYTWIMLVFKAPPAPIRGARGINSMTAEPDLLSCCPDILYEKGGFYDPEYTLENLNTTYGRHGHNIEVLDQVFPATIPIRSYIHCLSEDGAEENRSALRTI